jgi:hypothetical protein
MLVLAAGLAFEAMDGFTSGYIREDALILGSFAIASSFVLWLTEMMHVPTIGRIVIRMIFVVAVIFWVYVAIAILRSGLSPVIGIPLALGLSAMLYPIWLVTWFPTFNSEMRPESPQAEGGGTQSYTADR